MSIKIAKTAGFCFGVKRAVDLVYKEADNKCCEKIYTYGPIIHNEEVMKDMKSKGIEIIGDMPIYVADDSADVWSNPKQFQLSEDLKPRVVAGCPPDVFCEDGQLWGNPVYDWDYMKSEKTPFSWWRSRFAHAFKVYDVVRIDHFRAFSKYYTVPFGAQNAIKDTLRLIATQTGMSILI